MSKLTFSIDNSTVFIRGDVQGLLANRMARLYLEETLSSKLLEDEISIKVPENEDAKLFLMRVRKFLVERLGFQEDIEDQTKNIIQDLLDEEKKFSVFSEKAKSIKNNLCEKEDFEEFKNHCIKNIQRKLYPRQLLSAYHIAFSQNACNFSVPGAGKTTIVLSAYSYLKSVKNELKRVDKILVVGPLSSFGPWEDEFKASFGIPPKCKRISAGLSKVEKQNIFYGNNDIELILISYQGLSFIKEEVKYFLNNNRVLMVLDEAHKIKNISGGVWAEAVLELAPYCKARVVLTGTPLPNGYEDLINLYKFIWFNKNIIPYRPYQLKQMSKNSGDSRIPNLINSIDPFFLRISKKDLGLPVPIENNPIISKMSDSQRAIYDYIESKYFESSDSDKLVRDKFRKAKTIRLMQLSTNPKLLTKPLDEYYSELGIVDSVFIDDSQILSMLNNYDETPGKFLDALKIIQEIISNGGKVLVWTSFVENIKDFSKFLRKNGIDNRLLYGEIPIDKDGSLEDEETRETIIRNFHDKDSFKVLIANPAAAAESISLHKACHNAIYLDRTYNAATFIQSKDRIHRYGLKDEDVINYYYLVSEDSIDLHIDKKLKKKEARMLKVIESRDIPLFVENIGDDAGSKEEMVEMLRDYEARKNIKI